MVMMMILCVSFTILYSCLHDVIIVTTILTILVIVLIFTIVITAITITSIIITTPPTQTGYANTSSESYGISPRAHGPGLGAIADKKKESSSKWNPAFLKMVGNMAVEQKRPFDAKNFTQILGIGTNRVGGLALAILKDPNKKRTLTANGMCCAYNKHDNNM